MDRPSDPNPFVPPPPPSRGRPSVVPKVKTALQHWIAREGMVGGDRLPPERDLAKRLGIPRMTLRRVVDDMIEDDLLERQAGAGTFVKQRIQPIIGLAADFSLLRRQTSFFHRWVLEHARRLLDDRGYASRLMPFDFHDNKFQDDVVEMLRYRPVTGALLLTGSTTEGAVRRLDAAGVPHVSVLSQYRNDHLSVTYAPPVGKGVQTLVSQGHKRIGLFGLGFQRRPEEREQALRTAQACGATVKDQWIIVRSESEVDSVARGRAMADEWSLLEDRPDAILFVDHFEVQGFINRRLAQTGDFQSLPTIAIIEGYESPLDLPCPVWRVRLAITPVIERAVHLILQLIEGDETPVKSVCLDCPLTIECTAHAMVQPQFGIPADLSATGSR